MLSRKIFIWAVLVLIPSVAMAQPEEVTGADILANSAKAYAKISRYVGTSAVITRMVSQVSEAQAVDGASTANAKIEFNRGGKIKIEGIQTYGDRYSIISGGKTATLTYMADDKERIEKDLDVERAIGSMSAVSADAASAIPAALLDMRVYSPLNTLHAPQLQGFEKISIWECYKVVDFDSVRNIKSTFWIDRESFLIRQHLTEQGEMNLEGAYLDRPKVRESLEKTQEFMEKIGMKSITTLHIVGIEEAQ